MLFNQSTIYDNIWFFGFNTSNFTSTNQLLLSYAKTKLWRFEVVYAFPSSTSSSALNFILNQPPQNGSCSLSAQNGTTSSSLTISCLNWLDEHGIKDYLLHLWTNDRSQPMIVAYLSVPMFEVRFLAGENVTYFIRIRDNYDCVTEYNLSSVTVTGDLAGIDTFARLLASENRSTVIQVINSLLQQLNHSSAVPTNMFISPLGSGKLLEVTSNQSLLDQYKKKVNSDASIREYLTSFITSLPITTSNSIMFWCTITKLSAASCTKTVNMRKT